MDGNSQLVPADIVDLKEGAVEIYPTGLDSFSLNNSWKSKTNDVNTHYQLNEKQMQ